MYEHFINLHKGKRIIKIEFGLDIRFEYEMAKILLARRNVKGSPLVFKQAFK